MNLVIFLSDVVSLYCDDFTILTILMPLLSLLLSPPRYSALEVRGDIETLITYPHTGIEKYDLAHISPERNYTKYKL